MTMIVIGHHFAGHTIPLPLLDSRNDGGIKLPVSVRILHDGLAQRFPEELRNIARTILPRGRIGVGNAAGDADHSAAGSARALAATIALATGAKARADAAGVCRAGASQRFRDTSAEVADNRTLIKDPGVQALPLRERLGFRSHQAVGGIKYDDLLRLPWRQRQ